MTGEHSAVGAIFAESIVLMRKRAPPSYQKMGMQAGVAPNASFTLGGPGKARRRLSRPNITGPEGIPVDESFVGRIIRRELTYVRSLFCFL